MTNSEKKIDEMYKLIDGIEVAMFTTRRQDGSLVSRPMQVQGHDSGSDFYFVTDGDANKLDELQYDPHVNLAFYRNKTREWVSVSGAARVSQDRGKIRELYKLDWKAWFADEGGARNGGPDDPRITLILVEAHSVEYLLVDKPRPLVLFEVAKGIVTGKQPDIGKQRSIMGGELADMPPESRT